VVRREVRGRRLRELDEPVHGDPNLSAALDVLAPRFREAVVAAADAYRRAGVRAALVGGLASSAYGQPRTTRDIDFLVGDEAFVSHGVVVSLRAGIPQEACQVPIDTVPIPLQYRELYERALREAVESDVPGVLILRPEWVAITKLAGGRAHDIAAVAAMYRAESIHFDAQGRSGLTSLVAPHPRLRLANERAWQEAQGGEE
jgi:hypothetical protein